MTTRVQYIGDGVALAFGFPFWAQRSGDLKVSLGAEAQTAGYAVDLLRDADGGTVTFASPPLEGVLVTIERRTEPVRRTSFADAGPVRVRDLATEFDTIYARLVEVGDQLGANIVVWPAPASGPRAVVLTTAGALALSNSDPDMVAAIATNAAALAATAESIAEQALSATRPDGGAIIEFHVHTLEAGTQSYRCAKLGLPAPSANNLLVYYDTVRLRPDVAYTLDETGEFVVLVEDVVDNVTSTSQLQAGYTLEIVKIAGGLISADLSPEQIESVHLKLKCVTDGKLADGTPKALRIYDGSGRPAYLTGTEGQYVRFGADGIVAGGGPLVASEAEVRAGTDVAKIVPAALLRYGLGMPLFVGRWDPQTTNGPMSLVWAINNTGAVVSLSRIDKGKYRLSHREIRVVPLVTFIGVTAATPRLAPDITIESPTSTLIESWSFDDVVDAGVVVALYGSVISA